MIKRKQRRVSKPERIARHICWYLQHSTPDSYFNLFYLIEYEQSQFLVKAIKHHHLFEGSTFLVQMGCLGHLQQRIHISRQSVITNIVKVLYGFVSVTNL